MPTKSFTFVLNHILIDDKGIPLELIPGFHLDRATEDEVKAIREVIFSNVLFVSGAMGYGHDYDDKTGDIELTPKNWRYWVVRYDTPNTDLTDLQWTLNLHPIGLELGVSFTLPAGGCGYRPASLFQFFMNPESWIEKPSKVEVSSFQDTRTAYECIHAVRKSHPEIARSLNDFEMVKCLPRNSRFAALGYFMVLESVLTHNPHDTADSLNHQVSTKMPLVEKRFKTQLDYSDFGSDPHEKVWKRLYEYRSKIAHGGVPNLQKLKLKDDKAVIRFMQSAVRSLLLVAVREPVLITDLKAV